MAFANQGSRPNYMSTQQKINLPPQPYTPDSHQQWTVRVSSGSVCSTGADALHHQGGAVRSLSQVTAVDFDWPKRFWASLSAQDQQNLIR